MEDLHTQIRTVLAHMAIISDAEGVSYIPAGNHATHTSTGTSGPGGDNESLFDHWAARFAGQTDPGRLHTLLLLAQRELGQRTHRPPTRLNDHGDREDTLERDQRILDWFEGIPADEASILESASGQYCSAQAIRRTRRRNDRDPEHGRPQAPTEHRVRIASELRARGLSVRRIAREMNVAVSTAQAALEQAEQPRHAA